MKLCIILGHCHIEACLFRTFFSVSLAWEKPKVQDSGTQKRLAWNFFAAEGKGKPRERLLDNADGFWEQKV